MRDGILLIALMALSPAYADPGQTSTNPSFMRLILQNETRKDCMKFTYAYLYHGKLVAPNECPQTKWPEGCGYSTACNPSRTYSIPRPNEGESYPLYLKITDPPADVFYKESCPKFLKCNVTHSSCPSGSCIISVDMSEQSDNCDTSYHTINHVKVLGSPSNHYLQCKCIKHDPQAAPNLHDWLGGFSTAFPDSVPSVCQSPV